MQNQYELCFDARHLGKLPIGTSKLISIHSNLVMTNFKEPHKKFIITRLCYIEVLKNIVI